MTLRVVEWDTKNAGERRRRGFDLTLFCVNYWRPGIIVPAGFVLRPLPKALGGRGVDGYQYRASAQGQTGEREPRWAPSVTDGSVAWVQEALSADSLYRTISSPSEIEWIAPAEMTVDAPQWVVGVAIQIAAYHAGGTEGETHRVIARVPFSDGTIEDFGIDWGILDDQVE